MTDIAIIILAAGKGTRMKSPLPKVMHEIAGWPMVQHVCHQAGSLSPKKVVGVIGDDMAEVGKLITRSLPGAAIVTQSPQLGTGHAVQQALPALEGFKGRVVVLYADSPFVSSATIKEIVDAQSDVTVLGFQPDDPGAYGRLITDGDKLAAIVEYNDATDEQRGISLCNSGVMAFNADHITSLVNGLSDDNAKKEYYLTDCVGAANEQGLSCGYITCNPIEVMGVNSQRELAQANVVFQIAKRLEMMEKGVQMPAPDTVHFAADTDIAAGSVVGQYVVFGPGVVVEESVEIKPFSHIEGTHIRSGSSAGPFARLRPGTVLENDVRIGNFVETKQATIERGSKINHLSYVGDAEVGKNVNIGAGTITCNYDGFEKFRTIIGDHAFIGSNSSLVAPLSIGEKAIIGAGTTVLEDVPSQAVALNQKSQYNDEGGAARFRKKKTN